MIRRNKGLCQFGILHSQVGAEKIVIFHSGKKKPMKTEEHGNFKKLPLSLVFAVPAIVVVRRFLRNFF